jgi:hypothetical protein
MNFKEMPNLIDRKAMTIIELGNDRTRQEADNL